jgi:hypothetical protein
MDKQEKKLAKRLANIYIKSDELAQWSWNELCKMINGDYYNIEELVELYDIVPIGMLRYKINQKIISLKGE